MLFMSVNPAMVRAENDGPQSNLIADELFAPVIDYPISETILVKTPTYEFYKLGSFTKYQIEVYNDITKELLLRIKGAPVCSGDICWFKPDLKLKPEDNTGLNGNYWWRVRAKTGVGTWSEWSDPASFMVLSKQINSEFTVNMNKWQVVRGTWVLKTPTYLKGVGEYDYESSIVQKEIFRDAPYPGSDQHLVIDVMMKRKVEDNTPNKIYFMGTVEEKSQFAWNNGYMLRYTNNGWWGWYRVVDGWENPVWPSMATTFLNSYGWNRITIWTDLSGSNPGIHLWINGNYVDFFPDLTMIAVPMYGNIGIGFYEKDAEKSPLLLDYVKAYYSDVPPIEIP
jgi:hypothetical protein